ncbi:hypothetical protein K438DRAFT_1991246 [Mycena galopus ATCC 62051]|nr:hypothetical protein K438DRAFT_1991246 [Mycena galopus ATCC 62051]
MPTPAVIKASNASFHPSYVPIALFVGGTSGVGQVASEIIARFPKPASDGCKHEFVHCDLTLIVNVRDACADIRAKCARINFFVLTAGYNLFVDTTATSEGLDLLMEMYALFGSRSCWGSEARSEDVKVMSVLAAGTGSPKSLIDLENMGNVGKPREGQFKVAHFAALNPGIAFTHIHPGAVHTNALRAGTDCYIRVKGRKEEEGIGSGWVMTGLGNAGGQQK